MYFATLLSASVFSPLLFGIATEDDDPLLKVGPALCSRRRLTSWRMLRFRLRLSAEDSEANPPLTSTPPEVPGATWCFAVLT